MSSICCLQFPLYRASMPSNKVALVSFRHVNLSQSLVSSTTPPPPIRLSLGLPQLSLLPATAFFSLALVSIPTMIAFRNLAMSMDKLSKVVSEEVSGTLSSLKLSGLEISDLNQQLTVIRHRVSQGRHSDDNGSSVK